jgi:F-type H+-transporting ATPase subunit alpha
MSLLLKRSPGRDAYPGDIFYLHSRLLERTAKVLPDYGGGSITAMPMCETQNGDISEYITTNLMSITDGHIYLDAQMMHDGVLPAVNSGSSVSRIGGSIQPKLLRKLGAIAGGQLARYNEVKSYETMNTEITEETEREINRGKRILEIFTQPSGMNYTPAEETLLLHTVTGGLLDYVPLDIVSNMKVELINFYRDNLKDFNTITDISGRKDADDKDFSPFDDFIKQYVTRNNTPASNALKEVIDKKNEQKAAVQPKEGQKLEEVQAGSQATKPGTTEEEKANPEKEETASKEDANPEKGGQAKDESAKESQSKSDSNNQDGKKDK